MLIVVFSLEKLRYAKHFVSFWVLFLSRNYFLSIFYLLFSTLRLATILCSSTVPLGIVETTKLEDEMYDVNKLTSIWETCTKQEWYPPIYQTGDRTWTHVRNAELPRYPTGKGCFYPSSPPGCMNETVLMTVMATVASNCMKTKPSSSNHRTDPATVMTSEGSAWSYSDSIPTETQTVHVPSAALWNQSKMTITRARWCGLSPHRSDGSIPALKCRQWTTPSSNPSPSTTDADLCSVKILRINWKCICISIWWSMDWRSYQYMDTNMHSHTDIEASSTKKYVLILTSIRNVKPY